MDLGGQKESKMSMCEERGVCVCVCVCVCMHNNEETIVSLFLLNWVLSF